VSEYAATIAPYIDRLFIAGHAAARPHARRLLTELNVERPGPLIDLRALLLRPQGMIFPEAQAVERYVSLEALRLALELQVEQGTLDLQDGAWKPTTRGGAVLEGLTEALEHGLERLWGSDEAVVREAHDLAAMATDSAAQSVSLTRYPAFAAKRSSMLPCEASPSFRLWTQLDALRYLRADAHAAAWQETGLNAAEAATLTDLWRGVRGLAIDSTVSSLHARGWAEATKEGLQISARGRTAREEIERRTDELNAPAYVALSRSQGDRLLELLAMLPSEL
jgi:hypothetical protein